MTMITPSSELTLTKGTSPAGLNEFALPDGHLSLCQTCLRGYPSPLILGDEFVGGVLPLQFFELHLGVRHALLSPSADGAVSSRYRVCGGERKRRCNIIFQSTRENICINIIYFIYTD